MNNNLGKVAVLLGVIVTLYLTGCASHSSGRHRDANLSDAMKQASDRSEDDRRADDRRASERRSNDRRVPPADEQPRAGVSWGTERDELIESSQELSLDAVGGFGFEYSYIRYASSSLYDGRFYSFYREIFDEERTVAIGARVVLGGYTLPATGIVGDAIDAAHSWQLDGFVKIYGSDFSVFTAPYFMGAIGYGDLNWTYRQPITDSSGYTFSSDSLEFMEFKAGLGGELGRYGIMQLSVYAGPVARIYLGRTREGFNNDLFENRVDMNWGATVGLRF